MRSCTCCVLRSPSVWSVVAHSINTILRCAHGTERACCLAPPMVQVFWRRACCPHEFGSKGVSKGAFTTPTSLLCASCCSCCACFCGAHLYPHVTWRFMCVCLPGCSSAEGIGDNAHPGAALPQSEVHCGTIRGRRPACVPAQIRCRPSHCVRRLGSRHVRLLRC